MNPLPCPQYADPVADLLDKWGAFRARLFRESCVFHRGNYVKDLSRLGRDLRRIIIVDNSPASYIFHPDNAVRTLGVGGQRGGGGGPPSAAACCAARRCRWPPGSITWRTRSCWTCCPSSRGSARWRMCTQCSRSSGLTASAPPRQTQGGATVAAGCLILECVGVSWCVPPIVFPSPSGHGCPPCLVVGGDVGVPAGELGVPFLQRRRGRG